MAKTTRSVNTAVPVKISRLRRGRTRIRTGDEMRIVKNSNGKNAITDSSSSIQESPSGKNVSTADPMKRTVKPQKRKSQPHISRVFSLVRQEAPRVAPRVTTESAVVSAADPEYLPDQLDREHGIQGRKPRHHDKGIQSQKDHHRLFRTFPPSARAARSSRTRRSFWGLSKNRENNMPGGPIALMYHVRRDLYLHGAD